MGRTGSFVIYGANGYTGVLAARKAKALGLAPLLAGRNAAHIEALGRELGLPWHVVSLEDRPALVKLLREVSAVLHCAGPFSATARPMLDACIEAGAHYLDITGEVDVFEDIYAHHERLVRAGIAAVPGVGFDVVPTDCMAAMLKSALPSAERLRLAWRSTHAKASPGTAKTMIETLPHGARVRRNGKLMSVPSASIVARFPFTAEKDGSAVIIGLGDVASAYRSTGIRDIECFLGLPDSQIRSMRMARGAQKLLALGPVQRLLKTAVERYVQGPTEDDRARARMQLVGEVSAGSERVVMRMSTPEGYEFTAHAAVEAARRVANGEVPAGAWAPSTALGKDFVVGLPDVHIETVSRKRETTGKVINGSTPRTTA